MNKSLLLVIDFINEIVNSDYPAASCADFVASHQVMLHANEAIAIAREQGIDVVHVKVGYSDDYRECARHSNLFKMARQNELFKLSGSGCDFHHQMDVLPEDTVLVKHRISAFYQTGLDVLMDERNIDELVICGVSTNMAVELTAREAHDRDIKTTVLMDACAAATMELHQAAIANLKRLVNVCSVNQWLQSLGKGA
jgi:nicotinamidase-related amidase